MRSSVFSLPGRRGTIVLVITAGGVAPTPAAAALAALVGFTDPVLRTEAQLSNTLTDAADPSNYGYVYLQGVSAAGFDAALAQIILATAPATFAAGPPITVATEPGAGFGKLRFYFPSTQYLGLLMTKILATGIEMDRDAIAGAYDFDAAGGLIGPLAVQ